MRLDLVRHGLTDWNALGRFQGRVDRPLSDEGREQARRLGAYAGQAPIDLLYASPLARARETARIAFGGLEPAEIEAGEFEPGQVALQGLEPAPGRPLPLRIDERLAEIDFGMFEGRTLEENLTTPEWAVWYDDPFGLRAPGGESYADVRERAVAWMDDLPKDDDARIVAVTHSGVIQMLVAYVLGVERPRWRKRIHLRHAGLTRLRFRGQEAVVERVNDTRHLDGPDLDPFVD